MPNRSTSNLLTGHLPEVYPAPVAGPGARHVEPVDDNPWRKAQGTPVPEVETDEGTVPMTKLSGTYVTASQIERAITELLLDDVGPMARLAVSHGYEGLAAILDEALAQSQSGKGKERHANGHRFEEQPIFVINQLLGSLDGNAYQIIKKVQEGVRQVREGDAAGGRRNLLGAIVYAAATIGLIDAGVGGPPKR